MHRKLRRELVAIIEPDGVYALDWQYPGPGGAETDAPEFGPDWYELYRSNRDTAWFVLGCPYRWNICFKSPLLL
jgi:hypothetical protein